VPYNMLEQYYISKHPISSGFQLPQVLFVEGDGDFVCCVTDLGVFN